VDFAIKATMGQPRSNNALERNFRAFRVTYTERDLLILAESTRTDNTSALSEA
jgi:hypothetical protein